MVNLEKIKTHNEIRTRDNQQSVKIFATHLEQIFQPNINKNLFDYMLLEKENKKLIINPVIPKKVTKQIKTNQIMLRVMFS